MRPLIGRPVVCLSSIDWDFIWQGHQEIMSRIARSGDPVLFIENPGVRNPNLKDIDRILRRLKNWWRGVRGFRQERENLIVLSPLLLPFPYAWWARWINAWLICRAIQAWVRALRCDAPVVWTFLPTPLANDIVDALSPPVSVYHCIDDFQASSPGARRSGDSEAELLKKADLVFVTSKLLQTKALRHRSEALSFPNAVDYEKFEACRERGVREPEDVVRIPRPRCGYVGGLHKWVDFELLRQVALENPNISFVMVGPLQTDVSMLQSLRNIHLLGMKPHDSLPDYISSFDAGLIPYRVADYTRSVCPTKLNEYFAMGLPVVSTDLPDVRSCNETHGPLVDIAEDSGAFSNAVRRAVVAVSADYARRRMEVARSNGWDARVEEMARVVREKVSESRAMSPDWKSIVSRLVRKGDAKHFAVAASVLLLLAVMRWTPLVWWLAGPLLVAASPERADAIVVLAGGVGESGEAGQGHEERLETAIAQYRRGLAPKIILCSGYTRTFKEVEVMSAIALLKGVPGEALSTSARGGGTHEMIGHVSQFAASMGVRRIILISSPYHMRRAVMVWKKASPQSEIIPVPAARSMFYAYTEANASSWRRRGPTWGQLSALVRETATLAYYWGRGWI